MNRDQRTLLQQLAIDLHVRLVHQEPMPGERGCPPWTTLLGRAARKSGGVPEQGAPDALTVREALAAAYGGSYADQVNSKGRIRHSHGFAIKGKPSGGLAITTWTEHARELRRLADIVEQVLGPDAPWTSSEGTYTRLRDALIVRTRLEAEAIKAPQKLRRVHKVLQTYIRATRLVQKAYKDRDDVNPKPKALTLDRWLTDLKEAWTAADLPLPASEQPRYSRVEAGLIYARGLSGRHDPRYGLWLLLGAEGRPVQILRARRSQIEDTYRDTPRGIFRGPGTRLKHGLIYAFTPAHRVAVDEYLNGYLSEYEDKYQSGEIEDYPLFPAGALRGGKIAPFTENVRPWGYRQFLGDSKLKTGFYEIESAAGVTNVPGRGPYGIKYTIADLTPVVAGALGITDTVAVNLATAHDTPGTATQYRKRVRSQPGMLINVGRIVWRVRKELRRAASEGIEEGNWGLALDAERIRRYQVSGSGITVETVAGDKLRVPWAALTHVGKQDGAKVAELSKSAALRSLHELDDDAREIQFTKANVTMKLDAMLLRARTRGRYAAVDDREPELQAVVWWNKT